MATTINFPDSPGVGQEYTYGSITFKFNGTHWYVLAEPTLPLTDGKTFVGNESNIATERDFQIAYADVDPKLKAKATVTSTIDLSDKGIGEITLSGNTAFAFTNYQLNKTYLLKITPNGYTTSWSVGARHVAVEGNAEFGASGVFYVSLTCIDDTASAEKLLTLIMKEA